MKAVSTLCPDGSLSWVPVRVSCALACYTVVFSKASDPHGHPIPSFFFSNLLVSFFFTQEGRPCPSFPFCFFFAVVLVIFPLFALWCVVVDPQFFFFFFIARFSRPPPFFAKDLCLLNSFPPPKCFYLAFFFSGPSTPLFRSLVKRSAFPLSLLVPPRKLFFSFGFVIPLADPSFHRTDACFEPLLNPGVRVFFFPKNPPFPAERRLWRFFFPFVSTPLSFLLTIFPVAGVPPQFFLRRSSPFSFF